MIAHRLAEIKARCDAATEGPWVRDMHSPDMSGRSGWYIRGPRKLGLRSMVLNSRMLHGDAEFIEHAREDVGWLVDQVERLERWKVEALEVMSGLVLNSRMLHGDAEFIEHAREDVGWLVDQVERLERWKVEALEVMSGLRELGKALGLGLGVQITGPAALAEVERLTAERDALAAQVARVESLAEEWERDAEDQLRNCYSGRDVFEGERTVQIVSELRDALAGSEAEGDAT